MASTVDSGISPPPPPRSHSLGPTHTVQPSDSSRLEKAGEGTDNVVEKRVDLDLEEARRVWAAGMEGEVRDFCGKLIAKVEELSQLVAQYQATQTELETSLTVTRSNLTLAMANTEMLEEALKRAAPQQVNKDIGWRRWSDREGISVQRSNSMRNVTPRSQAQRQSQEMSDVEGGEQTSPPAQQQQHQQQQAPQCASSESRFFKFRFGTSASSPASPTLKATHLPPHTAPVGSFTDVQRSESPKPAGTSSASGSHWKSSSTTTLISDPPSPPRPTRKELELTSLLKKEREALGVAQSEKAALEDEIESLSAALFEEANKMVAIERRRCAEITEELKIVKEQKAALHSALKIVESENQHLRVATPALPDPMNRSREPTPAPIQVPDSSPQLSESAARNATESTRSVEPTPAPLSDPNPPVESAIDNTTESATLASVPLPSVISSSTKASIKATHRHSVVPALVAPLRLHQRRPSDPTSSNSASANNGLPSPTPIRMPATAGIINNSWLKDASNTEGDDWMV